MRICFLFLFAFLAVASASRFGHDRRERPVLINRPPLPKPNRYARSAEPEAQSGGSFYMRGQQPLSGPDRRPSFDAGYQHRFFENKHGSLNFGGGVQKLPGSRWEPTVGASATYRFRREAEPEPQTGGSLYIRGEKPLSGPDRRPTVQGGYEHRIFENKYGSVQLGGGVQKVPGSRWEPNVGASATFRFRREAEAEPQTGGSLYIRGEKPLSGPDRRPTFQGGYDHKIFENKYGSVQLGGGVQKVPGSRWEPNVGASATFRFRREAEAEPQDQKRGSVYVRVEKPMSGPDRRPTVQGGYEHKIFENKHGSIQLGGGVQKVPGSRWEPNVGLRGSFRFRREAEAEPQTGGSLYIRGEKPLSGPDRRPTVQGGYEHKIFENKYGSVQLGGGVQKVPGSRWEPNVGASASFRFRREAEAEPQTGGSFYIRGQQPLSGPDRRPTFQGGYDHKIFENKHGSIQLGGGVQKVPGSRWEPNVGLTGSFRFRREAEAEPQTGGSLYIRGEKPLSGPDRQPTVQGGYEHRIFENKYGSVQLGGGVQKVPGSRWEPNVGVSASFRFRREADEQVEQESEQEQVETQEAEE